MKGLRTARRLAAEQETPLYTTICAAAGVAAAPAAPDLPELSCTFSSSPCSSVPGAFLLTPNMLAAAAALAEQPPWFDEVAPLVHAWLPLSPPGLAHSLHSP